MRNLEVYQAIERLLARGGAGVLATVTGVRGSSPGALGSKMLVSAAGETAGTVGGGCVDGLVYGELEGVLRSGRPASVAVDLTDSGDPDHGLICGGRVTLFLEPMGAEDGAGEVTPEVLRLHERGERAVLATVLSGGEDDPPPGRKLLAPTGGEATGELPPELEARVREEAEDVLRAELPRAVVAGSVELFLEPIATAHLVICGSGHIAHSLHRLAGPLDLSTTVIDDRERFLNEERYPGARLVLGPFEETLARYEAPANAFIAVVTRGHRYDQECLEWGLRQGARYVGLVGSRKKIHTILGRAREKGFAEEELAKVRTPIGLDIGAVTVEEIAVAVAAELVAVRRRGIEASRELARPGRLDARRARLAKLPPTTRPEAAKR